MWTNCYCNIFPRFFKLSNVLIFLWRHSCVKGALGRYERGGGRALFMIWGGEGSTRGAKARSRWRHNSQVCVKRFCILYQLNKYLLIIYITQISNPKHRKKFKISNGAVDLISSDPTGHTIHNDTLLKPEHLSARASMIMILYPTMYVWRHFSHIVTFDFPLSNSRSYSKEELKFLKINLKFKI